MSKSESEKRCPFNKLVMCCDLCALYDKAMEQCHIATISDSLVVIQDVMANGLDQIKAALKKEVKRKKK